jgi:hypothetical protein
MSHKKAQKAQKEELRKKIGYSENLMGASPSKIYFVAFVLFCG